MGKVTGMGRFQRCRPLAGAGAVEVLGQPVWAWRGKAGGGTDRAPVLCLQMKLGSGSG